MTLTNDRRTHRMFRDPSGQTDMFETSYEEELAQKQAKPVECLGRTFASEEERRRYYTEELRRYLRDPEFRRIEGFPIGEDEDILALSDPPYYTACPNPFLPDIIAHWRQEREALRRTLGLPDDSHDNGNGDNGTAAYHREPFAADVSEGKNHPIYNAHSYHTKVPHKAIMRYILHYTEPGDMVFDGFCGTGMTGVAAQLCGDRAAVEELGYYVDQEGFVYDSAATYKEQGSAGAFSRLGARVAALVDLSPAATFIAYNYNTPVDVEAFEREARRILREVERECGWLYETWHPHCDDSRRVKGRSNYTVWSDVFLCPECGHEMDFWAVAVDHDTGEVRQHWPCPGCGARVGKSPSRASGALKLERAMETAYDRALETTIERARQVPVLINYSVGKARHEKRPDAEDLALIARIEEAEIPYWFPTDRMPEGDKTGDPLRVGITHVHHFFTSRNLRVLAALWKRYAAVDMRNLRGTLLYSLTAAMRYTTRMAKLGMGYYFHGGGGAVNAGVLGTLYVPSFSVESNVLRTMSIRTRKLLRVLRSGTNASATVASTASASAPLSTGDALCDYIFVDPPFGGNLMYSELNFLWESWLEVITNSTMEAIENRAQAKGLPEYQRLLEACCVEFYRALKPGRWMTVEFHNSQNRVWNAIQEAILRAGFVVADVRLFDKQQGTFNQVTTSGAVKQDLIISAYKPRGGFERRFLEQGGTPEGAWAFTRQHLEQLPQPAREDGVLEPVAERQAHLLYDRMVAFHVQRGVAVPLSAGEFYAGLRERFVPRDGMYFLPDQVPAYDREKLQAERVGQLALFVTDEKSAIRWLRQRLDPALGGHPQTYQDILPDFLRSYNQARHEAMPELREILDESFLQDEQGRYYAPDPNRAGDLERLRRRALLREFRAYAEGRGRLRQFRSEAVRAGFADAWSRRDYATIVRVAERLPEAVLQEDQELLMYYDNASLRVD